MVSATKDEIESDITLIGSDGQPLAVFTGFTLQALSASSRMSPERIDKGLYEIEWVARAEMADDSAGAATSTDSLSWLIFLDSDGVGTTLADQLRRSGHRVRAVLRQPVSALTKVDGGYFLNPQQPEQLHQLIATHVENDGDLAGIINCWPLDIPPKPTGCPADTSGELNDQSRCFHDSASRQSLRRARHRCATALRAHL